MKDKLHTYLDFRLSKLNNCCSAVFEDCGRPLILFTPMLSVDISFRVQVFLNRNPYSTRFLIESWLFYYIANFQLLKFLKFQMTNIINLFLLFVLFSYRWKNSFLKQKICNHNLIYNSPLNATKIYVSSQKMNLDIPFGLLILLIIK